jgi:hypothetical protein
VDTPERVAEFREMVSKCLQWQAVVNPTEATDEQLDEIRVYFEKVIQKGEKLMEKLNQ